MGGVLGEPALLQVVGAAYECALEPERWPALLDLLARTFRSGFADVFARTQDRTRWQGLAYGLDRDDYQDVFLGTWVRRNVWSLRQPVEHAGEVVTTREIMPPDELRRTAMYNDYLAPRGLHEGLRLSLWAGDGWVQYVSLLRPWSAGPFGAAELAVARTLLPHLQRAAAVTRRLGEAEPMARAGLAALDGLRQAAFVLDGQGRPLRMNRRADALAAEADGLLLGTDGLSTSDPALSGALRGLLARALGLAPPWDGAGSLRIPRRGGGAPLTVTTVPLRADSDWPMPQAPAALVLVEVPGPCAAPDPLALAARFGLTSAEADLAAALAAGLSLAEAAARRGRSLSTMRTHLARLMSKTGVSRQAALVHLLLQQGPGAGAASLPHYGRLSGGTGCPAPV